jgi:hypothetical protein
MELLGGVGQLLGGVGHVESRVYPCGDSVSVSAGQGHGLCQTYHWLKNHSQRIQ